MAQENITIELPESEQTAVIKSYIPHKVARKIQNLYLGKQQIKPAEMEHADKAAGEKILAEMTITGEDLAKFSEILVVGLLVQLGEHYASEEFEALVDDLSEGDFQAISNRANEIYRAYQEKTSPKELPLGKPATSEN